MRCSTSAADRAPAPARERRSFQRLRGAIVLALVISSPASLTSCSRQRDAAPDSTAAVRPAAVPSDSVSRSASTIEQRIRGKLDSITAETLVVSADSGLVRVALAKPITVYTRMPAKLADVSGGSFVGITSVPQPGGSQRATEIHVFPEALRGTGEGSYPMQPQAGAPSNRTMTNGTVAASRMTNGTVSRRGSASTVTVTYKGGSQTIVIPADVPVMRLAATQERIPRGANVVVVATKEPNGGYRTSKVFWIRENSPR